MSPFQPSASRDIRANSEFARLRAKCGNHLCGSRLQRATRLTFVAVLFCTLIFGQGCGLHSGKKGGLFGRGEPILLENPLFVPQTDIDFVWNQLVDELDNYFKIRREDRVRIIDNILTEGWIETYPVSGSTILEPWRRDSMKGYERRLATLQSIRRWARVRVMPAPGGFRIEVNVFKELEDLDQPENASVGGATMRYDDAIDSQPIERLAGPDTYGWIPLGRDQGLEQKILSNVLGRVTNLEQ